LIRCAKEIRERNKP